MQLFERAEFSTFQDNRGTLREVFTAQTARALGIEGFPHALYVSSYADVLRGMHFQVPPQGKYVVVLQGIVDLFGLDLRAGVNYGKMTSVKAFEEGFAGGAWWLPPGCAFGYRTHTPAKLLYFLSAPRSHDEYAIQFFDSSWNTRSLGMHQEDYIISDKDKFAPTLAAYEEKRITPL